MLKTKAIKGKYNFSIKKQICDQFGRILLLYLVFFFEKQQVNHFPFIEVELIWGQNSPSLVCLDDLQEIKDLLEIPLAQTLKTLTQ